MTHCVMMAISVLADKILFYCYSYQLIKEIHYRLMVNDRNLLYILVLVFVRTFLYYALFLWLYILVQLIDIGQN